MLSANRAPFLHLDKHYLQTDQNELPLDLHHLGVPSGVPKEISMLVVCLVQIMHLSCTEIKTITKRIKMSFCLMHVTLEYNKVRPK